MKKNLYRYFIVLIYLNFKISTFSSIWFLCLRCQFILTFFQLIRKVSDKKSAIEIIMVKFTNETLRHCQTSDWFFFYKTLIQPVSASSSDYLHLQKKLTKFASLSEKNISDIFPKTWILSYNVLLVSYLVTYSIRIWLLNALTE